MKAALSCAFGLLVPALAAANLAFLALLWFVETYIAERHWLGTLIAYAPQHAFGIPTLLILAAAIWRRDWLAGVVCAVAGVFFLFALLGLRVPLRVRPASGGVPVRVMTYNIHQARGGPEAVADVIRRQEPDILCLQEAESGEHGPDPVAELQQLLPGWHVARHGEIAIFARHPIRSGQGSKAPMSARRAFLWAEVEVKGHRLTLAVVHFTTAAHPGRLLRDPGPTADHLRVTAKVRLEQAAALLRLARSLPAPLVIAGDFNTPPRGRIYRRLTRRYRDAFDAAGWGFGHTFRSDRPVLRIDHILTSPDIRVRRCFVPDTSASDHLPVVADLLL